MLGDTAVGKTALIQQFVNKTFSGSYKATMGLDISLKEVEVHGMTVRLQLWDMGGQDSFISLRGRYFSGARGAILVYDTTRPSTFNDLQRWLQELKNNVPRRIPFIILGNKTDLTELVVISEEEEKTWGSEVKSLANFRTSAKTGENVEEAFETLAVEVLKKVEN